jgi:hypothetical protein
VRAAALAAVLGLVLAASALELSLGLLWVGALLGLLFLRRRMRAAPWLAVVASGGLLAAGMRWGGLDPPAAAPYEAGWLRLASVEGPSAGPGDEATRLAGRLRELVRIETGVTGVELEARTAAALAFARRVEGLRGRAPREVAAVQDAARRLARTLATPEFRDLEGRRRRVAEYLAEAQRRVATAGGVAELAAIRRALDPAAMAGVSLRAVREDLGAAAGAAAALVRALGGSEPVLAARVTVRVDEAAGALRRDVRYLLWIERPARLVRLHAGALRGALGEQVAGEYGLDEAPLRPLPSTPWLELDGARRARLLMAGTERLAATPVRGPLRLIRFWRLEIGPVAAGDDLPVVVGLDQMPGFEAPLAPALPPAALDRLLIPAHALHHVSRPGTVAREEAWDAWLPADRGVGHLGVELAPATPLVRTRLAAAARPYLYGPNAAAALAVLGLAGLTVLLARRRPAA